MEITKNVFKDTNHSHNPIFLDYYHKKIADGKTKRQAFTCVMRRINNIIYNILKNNVPYKHPKKLNEQCLEKIEMEKTEEEKV